MKRLADGSVLCPLPAIQAQGRASRTFQILTRIVAWFGLACLVVHVGYAANQPPTIGPIPNQVMLIDAPTEALALTLSDPETPLLSLQLSGVSSNPTLVPSTNTFFAIAGGV